MSRDQRPENDDDRERLDLAAWEAPPAPAGLTDRVLAAVTAPPVASARELPTAPSRRRTWSRTLAVALTSAALAAATTAALLPGRSAQTVDVTITPTADRLEVASAGGARVHVRTPLGVLETGPEPARFALSPATTASPAEDDMQRKTLALGGGAALLAAGLAVLMHEGTGRVAPADTGGQAGSTAVVAPGQTLTLAPAAPPRTGPRLVDRTTKDRALRDEVAAAIVRAREQRTAARAGSALPPPPALAAGAPPVLSKDVIRTGVREVIPMLADCYQQELLDRRIAVDGKLVAHLVVEGEPEVGTVVSVDDQRPSELDFQAHDERTGAAEPELAEAYRSFTTCVEATLESVVLPPLPEGERVEITYPFAFASIDEDAESVGSGAPPAPPAPPAPRPPPPEPAPSEREPAATRLDRANRAATSGQWGVALALAQELRTEAGDPALRERATLVTALAQCNLRQRTAAMRTYRDVPAHRRTMVRQACLKNGFDPEP